MATKFQDEDIFGTPFQQQQVAQQQLDSDIFQPIQPMQQAPQLQAPQAVDHEQTMTKRVLNSPVGGLLQGLGDIPVGGAQLLSHVMPDFMVNKIEKETGVNVPSDMDKYVKEREQNYKQNWRGGQDVGSDWGRIAGNIIPGLLVPGGATSTLGRALATGAVMGAVQPVTGDKYASEKAGQVALGAAGGGIGYGAGKVVGGLLNPAGTRVPPESIQGGLSAANRLGVELTPGQRTGSVTLQQLDTMFAKNPATAGMVGERLSRNQAAINQAAGRAIGMDDATSLTEDVLSGARSALKKKYGDLTANTIVKTSDDFINTLSTIDANNKALGSFASNQIDDLVNKGLDLAQKGELSGKAYQSIRSSLNDRASDAYRAGNSELGRALEQMTSGLDSAAKSGLDDAGKAMWDLTRKQYAALKTLEKGQVVQAGDVVPSRVAGALRQFNPQAYKEGSLGMSPLMDIARVGETFKNAVPTLEASQPTLWNQMIFGNPVTGIPAMAGARVAYNVYNNPMMQQYLSKGLLPVDRNMAGAMGGLLGAGYASQMFNR